MTCSHALLAFAASALMPVCAMAQDPIHLGAEGYWTVFKLVPTEGGGTTCYIQMNDTRRGRDWAVVISGNMLTGMLFSLGDTDGSTKSATSLRITFDGPAMPDKPTVFTHFTYGSPLVNRLIPRFSNLVMLGGSSWWNGLGRWVISGTRGGRQAGRSCSNG